MIKMKSLAVLTAIVGMTALVSQQAVADAHDAGAAKQKVVYHINYDNPKDRKSVV